ncbi:MAG: 6-phosphofructokinase [Anaerolineae bacterium]|nr:MAG: 6-phosphofructokinase [Anaerolineae bacterium]
MLTSGGDAPGMNAAVRAVVRTVLHHKAQPYAIYEGYQGMVEGGERIRRMTWEDVGGILQRGGTVIGTARSAAFRTHEGRRTAAKNLLAHGIDRLVVIGGDGSLTGANIFREEWPRLLEELVAAGEIAPETARRHPHLGIVGLVGSIDNDFFGTDMTIGADTALHRIVEAVDAISSTAASHQRTFVVKVMGRNCGYLALMGAIATGADWVLIPENPPEGDDWEEHMVERLRRGRQAGRRDSIVIIAEGARDMEGNPIGSGYVRDVLEKHLNEEVRVTVLGHVQRGGRPSAFDRNLGTRLGHAAATYLLTEYDPQQEPQVIGLRGNRTVLTPLTECVRQTQAVAEAIQRREYQRAMQLRGSSFAEAMETFLTLIRAQPRPPQEGQSRIRLAVMNAGAPAPGMNTAARAAVRLGIDQGHTMLGVRNGFAGLVEGNIEELTWMSVNGWTTSGGSELGTNRHVPEGADFYAMARNLEKFGIQGLLVIGGLSGYEAAYRLLEERKHFPAFNIPIVCLPASINNNLPGSELSIGADTALNNIVDAVDKIKQSAVAARRCFVVEVMGRRCGYLALMSGLATGAERVYLHEEGITLRDLEHDVRMLSDAFQRGKRLGLMIRNEHANKVYTTAFISALFEEEGGSLFDVRQAILGHLQQGGDPSPFDRIQATRLATHGISYLLKQVENGNPQSAFIGMQGKEIRFHDLEDFPRMVDLENRRPRKQWWMEMRPIARLLATPASPPLKVSRGN